jgi:hypothetical protein
MCLGNRHELVNVRLEDDLRAAVARRPAGVSLLATGVDLPISRCREQLGGDAGFDQNVRDDECSSTTAPSSKNSQRLAPAAAVVEPPSRPSGVHLVLGPSRTDCGEQELVSVGR